MDTHLLADGSALVSDTDVMLVLSALHDAAAWRRWRGTGDDVLLVTGYARVALQLGAPVANGGWS